jgi:pyruvate carboxylase
MNSRIQVEHTVTEEVTDVDLVQAQLRIAAGETLADLGLSQDRIALRGTAVQCRITTEDPANGFRPDTGVISAYRSPGGAGIRLDGGTTHAGATVSAHFDSMLVKLTCRGGDFDTAVRRARRAVAEFRIRGVATNIPFLQAVLDDPDFRSGTVTTAFIEERPHLLTGRRPADRGTRLLGYLADVTVNRPHGPRPSIVDPTAKLPALDLTVPAPDGSRQRLRELGPAGFAAWLRGSAAVGVTERLAALRSAIPNVCLQMLLRGRNTVGYTPYPEEVTRAFVTEAAATGIDMFRIFDALNDVEQMRPAIEAVRETGTAVAEVALCYTADLSDPAEQLYTLDYYLRLAERLVAAGAHVLAIKDMAGLLRPPAAARLVAALRREFELPIHLHTHDTPGGQLATYLAAIAAGADAVDGASAALAGTTSQPALSAIVAATDHTAHASGLALERVCDLEPYWEAVRKVYAPFESGIPAPTGRVYRHEIPGGQLSNLRQQAIALGLGDRFEEIEAARCEHRCRPPNGPTGPTPTTWRHRSPAP